MLLRTEVEDILGTLTPRERRVLQLRFGLIGVSPDSNEENRDDQADRSVEEEK